MIKLYQCEHCKGVVTSRTDKGCLMCGAAPDRLRYVCSVEEAEDDA